jgi:hypothetical protein
MSASAHHFPLRPGHGFPEVSEADHRMRTVKVPDALFWQVARGQLAIYLRRRRLDWAACCRMRLATPGAQRCRWHQLSRRRRSDEPGNGDERHRDASFSSS